MLEEINALCLRTAINTCWRQWAALGALVTPVSGRTACAVIDPEALLLLSAALHKQERRLEDVMRWWGAVGSTHLSLPRLTAVRGRFSERVDSGIAVFAQAAVKSGDRRWRAFDRLPQLKRTRRLKGITQPALTEPAALLFRLRAGFGVSIKSDVLGLLLGMGGSIATVKRMVDALSYSRMAIYKAAREMARARLVEKTADRPIGYFVHVRPWSEVLRLDPFSEPESAVTKEFGVPPWRFWPQLFAFLSDVCRWTQLQASGQRSAYLLSSQARDLYYNHKQAFVLNGIPVPEAEAYKGEQYLEAFHTTLTVVSDWLDQNL